MEEDDTQDLHHRDEHRDDDPGEQRVDAEDDADCAQKEALPEDCGEDEHRVILGLS